MWGAPVVRAVDYWRLLRMNACLFAATTRHNQSTSSALELDGVALPMTSSSTGAATGTVMHKCSVDSGWML